MFVFWDLVTRPLLGLLAPKRIVEVGSDHGDNTAELLKFARETGAVVHVIDPLPKYDEKELEAQWGEALIFHKSLSLNVLHEIADADLVLIDGDHNWYTVRNELELIFKNTVKQGRAFPFVLLHDVGWPYGRRDLYYNPETIPPAYLLPHKQLGMLPGQRELVEEGGLNPHLHNSIYENNLRNGVRTAVEDFVADAGEGYRFVIVPAFNGLGILFRPEDYASNSELMRFIEGLPHEGQAGAFVARLEQIRIEGDLDRNALKRRLNAQKEKGVILKTKLTEANAEIQAKVIALEAQRQTLEAQRQTLETQRQEATAREAELSGRINALEKDLHDANHQAVLTVQAKVKTIGNLENKLIAAQKDVETAKAELGGAKKEKSALQASEAKLNARLSEVEAQIAGLIGDREALRVALSEAEAAAMIAAGERESLRSALSAAEAANAIVVGEREQMRAALSAAEAANAVAAGETQSLRAALSAAEAANAIAAGERAQKSEAAAIAEQARAAGERAKAEAEHKALAFETYSLRSEVAQLKKKLAEAARQRAALENSTMGRVMSRVRATAQSNPKLASFVGRTGQLTWWTVSLQLPQKLKSRRELQNALTRIRNSRIFDADWYLERYPDVANAGVDPALHYYQHGGKSGRDPGPHFSGRHYLDSYPEVAQRGLNPLLDYLDNGAKAGRKPNPNFDSAYYLQSNPDVARSGMNPLDHWIKRGRAENRKTAPWLETPAIAAPAVTSPGYVNGATKPRSTRQTPVDVIIPINGAAGDVARLLQEINAWRRPEGQLILVEDGVDAPGRASIDDFFAGNESAVLVRNVRKRGLAASINQGLSEVASPYAAVLTSFGPGALKALNTTLTTAKSQSGFTAAPVLITPQMQARPTHTDAPQEGDNTVGFVLSRDALTKVGFFGEEAKFTTARAEWERRAAAASQMRAN